jgi:two-component system copper resistance phosphate regulon response regulator CusR
VLVVGPVGDPDLCEELRKRGGILVGVESVSDARTAMAAQAFDAVVVDYLFCLQAGLLLPELRAANPRAVLLAVVPAKMPELARTALERGFDAYAFQPLRADVFSRLEDLVAARRVERRLIRVEDLDIDCDAGKVWRAGYIIELTPRELELLEYLARRAGQPVPLSALAQQVWQLASAPPTNIVQVSINHLRAKIDAPFPRKLIRTIRGIGYQLGGEAAPRVTASSERRSSSLRRQKG